MLPWLIKKAEEECPQCHSGRLGLVVEVEDSMKAFSGSPEELAVANRSLHLCYRVQLPELS